MLKFTSEPRDGILLDNPLAAGDGHALQARTVVVQSFKGVRNRLGIPRRHKYAVHLILHDLRNCADRCYYRHRAISHAFQQGVGQAFGMTRKYEYIGALPQPLLGGIKNGAEELHSIIEPSLPYRFAKVALRGTGTREPQMDLDSAPAQYFDSLHGVEYSFAVGEPADVHDFKRAIGRITRKIQVDFFYVDGIGDQHKRCRGREPVIRRKFARGKHHDRVRIRQAVPQQRCQETIPGEQLLGEGPTMYLVHNRTPQPLCNGEVYEVAPVSFEVERGVDVYDPRIALQEAEREGEGASKQAQQCSQAIFGAPFATDLELTELEARGQLRFEELIQVGGHAADSGSRRAEK
jgi:hypothetical protein